MMQFTRCLCLALSVAFNSLPLYAASGTWTGADNALWANSANWSASPYPGSSTGETATLDSTGNGNTVLDLLGLGSILNITFTGAGAAPYTLGSGGINGQTLTLENSGTLALGSTAANSQTVNASVLLGTNAAGATYTFQNDNIANALTFEGDVAGAASGGTPGTKTLNLSGYGHILLKGVLSSGGATALALNSYGTNTLSGDNTFAGNIIVYDGTLRLTHSNALGAGSKTITAANNVNGRNPSIVLDGSAGGLTIPASVTFNTSQSRAGAVINEAGNNTILGNFTLTSGDGATHIWSKGGTLTLAGTLRPTTDSRQLYLRGDGNGVISGVITNGGTTTGLPVYRDVGTGTWTLSGSNTYSGATSVSTGTLALAGANGSINASSSITVNGGASLVISNTAAANHADRVKNTAPVTLNSASIAFANDGSSASFAETLGVVTLSSGTCTVSATPAAEGQTSALTLSGLARVVGATMNFVGGDIGDSDRNRIFIGGIANGPIGPWATVNGTAPALYSSARGVYADTVSEVAAKGDVIVDSAGAVSITSEGTSGANELSAVVTTIGALLQNSVFASTANTADKTLRVDNVSISPAQADLTLGVVPNDGAVAPTTTGGKIEVANFNSAATLAVNAVIADNGAPSSLAKYGAGDVVLYGTNTLSGVVTIDQGAVRLRDSLALQSASLGSAGAVFDSSVASHAFTLGNLTNTFALPLTDSAARPLALSVGNNSANSSFGGAFSSSGTLHKVGAGTLTLTGTSTHSGGTTVSGGTLATGVAGGLGIGPVANDAVLNLTGGGITYTALGTSLSGAGTVNVTLGTGTAQTTLNGDFSAYTGIWNIGASAAAGAGKALMSGPDNAAAAVNVLPNATLYCTGAVAHAAALTLYGGDTGEANGQLRLVLSADWSGPVTLAGDVTGAGDGFFGCTTGTGTISGVVGDLNGPHEVRKVAAATFLLSNPANTYGGKTTVTAGALGVTKLANDGEPSSLGQPSGANNVLSLGSGSTSGQLTYLGTGDTTDRVIDMAGTTGAAYLDQSGSGLLTFTSDLTYSGNGGKTLYLQGSTDGTGALACVVADGLPYTNKIVKAGTGTWRLSKANTYRGETEIQNGTLTLAHSNAVSQASLLRFTGYTGALELAGPGIGETANDLTIGVGNAGTLISGVPSGSVGLNHSLGGLSLSSVTLNVARASGVLSGTPSVSASSLNLSAGAAGTTTLNPTTADLILGSAAILSGNYTKTLLLGGTSAGNSITDRIYTTTGTLVLNKANSSTWTLSGSNTYSGATTVNGGTLALSGPQGAIASSSSFTVNSGGTLCLSNSADANHPNRLRDAAAVTLAGGTLDFQHAGGAADYSETLGAVSVTGAGSALRSSQADSSRTSALTLTSLARSANATIDFSGTGLGAADLRNRILISGHPNGLVGVWATYGGNGLAAYDGTLGVYAGSTSTSELAARGPTSTIPDVALALARITTAGSSGPITLAGASVNSVATLIQSTSTPAVVDTASKTLRTHALAIDAGQEALTIGTTEGSGTLTALASGGKLELVNDSSAALTVNAAVADNASASSLSKLGAGDVVLKGATTYTGATTIGAGSLVFGGHAFPQTLSGVVGGSGTLVKSGTNELHLMAANTYTGPTYINEGVVRPDQNTAFGTSAGGVFIADGATLDIGCTPDVGGTRSKDSLNLGTEIFTVSGTGVGGMGVIVNVSTTQQNAVFGKITLAADATFGGTQRWDLRNNTPTLTLNDHTLTKAGPNTIGLTGANIIPGSGHIDIASGIIRLESGAKLNGDVSNTLTVRSGAELELYKVSTQQGWTLLLESGSTFDAANNSDAATQNRWAGPITLNGAVTLTGGSGYVANLLGLIAGSGPLTKTGSANITISGTNNTYTGATLISAGTLIVSNLCSVGVPCSLGQPANAADGTIKLGSTTTAAALTYLGTGDTSDRTLDLAGTTGGATLTHSGSGLLKFTGGVSASGSGHKTLTVSSPASGSVELGGPIVNSAAGKTAITKNGSGPLALTGNNSFTGDVSIAAGSLAFSGANAQGPGAINVASGAGNTTMSIGPGAALTGSGGFRLGNASGSHAALYMTGGTVNRTPAMGDDLAFTVGKSSGSYGYFKMSGGDIKITRIQTGFSGSSTNTAVGNVRMTGGTLTLPDYLLLARGKGSLSAFTVDGGTIIHTNASNNLSIGYEGGRGELNLTGGTLESYGKYLTVRQSANNPTGIVNLCAGSLSIDLMQNTAPGVALLNFAGGTLKAGNIDSLVFIPSSVNGVYSYGHYGSYAGGAFIDTGVRKVTLAAPLQAPAGNGVYAITLADNGYGYIGEPYVSIEGGDGVGATAVANMEDDGTGSNTFKVASVTITSPGFNYVIPPTVTFLGGGNARVLPTVESVTLTPNTSGGLTKLGSGTLTLGAANTYNGTTTVSNGTLKLGVASALPTNSTVVLAGGVLDLGGYTVTNTVSGTGSVTNGTLRTVLSPAGEGNLGSDTLSLMSAVVSGTYLADVTSAGACDSIAVQGNINLSNLSLQIVDPDQLDRHNTYTILTCTGVRTGTFSSSNLPDSRWHLIYLSDGTVKLFYAGGTMVRIR